MTHQEERATRTFEEKPDKVEFFLGLLYPFAMTYVVLLFVSRFVAPNISDAPSVHDISTAFNPVFAFVIIAGSVLFVLYKMRRYALLKIDKLNPYFLGEFAGIVLSLAYLWFTIGIL